MIYYAVVVKRSNSITNSQSELTQLTWVILHNQNPHNLLGWYFTITTLTTYLGNTLQSGPSQLTWVNGDTSQSEPSQLTWVILYNQNPHNLPG